ncbi:MAG: PDZ domain-containing protein [Pseudomonadota bacterium]|nr:PDZ domain-containing protein [Pseudomonadota bacterium]
MQRRADGGPSVKAGVEVGDIIVSVGDKPVKGQIDFFRKLWVTGGPGTKISLGVLKPGKGLQILPVTAGDRYRWLRMSRGN